MASSNHNEPPNTRAGGGGGGGRGWPGARRGWVGGLGSSLKPPQSPFLECRTIVCTVQRWFTTCAVATRQC